MAVEGASAGAAIVAARFRSDLQRIDKGGGDLATDVDLAAEAAIVAVLRARRPDDAVLGEESGRHVGGSGRLWLIDPLCGTLNYAAGTGPVAVNVALRSGSTPDATDLAAAVADPVAGDLYWAGPDGAGLQRGGEDGPVGPDPTSRLVDVNLDAPEGPPPTWVLGLLGDAGFWSAFRGRVVSSSIALAWVADGRRAAYVTDGDVRDSVHFAAGIALCRAAGCVVTDLAGGPVASGDGLVAAADGATSDRLLALIAEHAR